MNVYLIFFSFILVIGKISAESIALDNQTSHPLSSEESKIAIQWAKSAKEIDEENHALQYGLELNFKNIDFIKQKGEFNLNVPEKAEYFRIIAWSKKEEKEPDHVTNWIEITPQKKYTLKQDDLIPVVLMSGMGC